MFVFSEHHRKNLSLYSCRAFSWQAKMKFISLKSRKQEKCKLICYQPFRACSNIYFVWRKIILPVQFLCFLRLQFCWSEARWTFLFCLIIIITSEWRFVRKQVQRCFRSFELLSYKRQTSMCNQLQMWWKKVITKSNLNSLAQWMNLTTASEMLQVQVNYAKYSPLWKQFPSYIILWNASHP